MAAILVVCTLPGKQGSNFPSYGVVGPCRGAAFCLAGLSWDVEHKLNTVLQTTRGSRQAAAGLQAAAGGGRLLVRALRRPCRCPATCKVLKVLCSACQGQALQAKSCIRRWQACCAACRRRAAAVQSPPGCARPSHYFLSLLLNFSALCSGAIDRQERQPASRSWQPSLAARQAPTAPRSGSHSVCAGVAGWGRRT